MKILTVDIGTGTQDIYLFDSRLDIENGFKLVVPSPTMIVHKRILRATQMSQAICLVGVTMGGGPSHWATEGHLRAGLPVYATPEAARSFNDDLDIIAEMGIQVIGEEEVPDLPDTVVRLNLQDFEFSAIARAFDHFDVSLKDLAAIGIAVFDHGAAPPNVSDRKFRFDYLDRRIRAQNQLTAFAYRSEEVPAAMTRMRAVVHSAKDLDVPLVVMDTAPAAILGATYEAQVAARSNVMIANVGNFHTLAFRLGTDGIEGVFEHHTGMLTQNKLAGLLRKLASGKLSRQEVFDDHGHGALIYQPTPMGLSNNSWDVAVTGPRRAMMKGSDLGILFPAPFGDMMLTGCFGLLGAIASLNPGLHETLRGSLYGGGGQGTPPWEIN
jgi:uncharacterized protein (DUF1786 family)